MKVKFAFLLWIICLCAFGCSDEGRLFSEQMQAVVSPSADVSVTDLPPEMWDALAIYREEHLNFLQYLVDITTGEDEIKAKAAYDEELRHVNALKTRQEAYYNRFVNAGGIAIIGNEKVVDKHFLAARDAILMMTSKYPELRERLLFRHGFYMILYHDYDDQRYVPEFYRRTERSRPNEVHPAGCSMSAVVDIPHTAGFCEGPLRLYPPGRIGPLQTFIHEFTHALDPAMERLKPGFYDRLEQAHKAAKASGIWEGTAVDRNSPTEYLAEGVEVWFYSIGPDRIWVHTAKVEFPTYEAFFERDPLLAELLDEWFPCVSLRLDY